MCREDVLYYYVTAKEKRSYERVHVCLYVRVTLTLQHVSLLTLEGIVSSLVVPTAVETASILPRSRSAQTGREKHLKYVSCKMYQINV